MTVKDMKRHDIDDFEEDFDAADPDSPANRENGEFMDTQALMEMYEESFKPIQEGQIVQGEIVDIGQDKVLVDIGYKYEGEVSKREFADIDGKVEFHVGDRVEVYLVRRDEDGYPVLSREEVRTERRLEEIGRNYETGEKIRGRILSRIKGGFFVDIGIKAFLPASQLDIKPAKDPDAWLGTDHEFRILQFDKAERNVVLSRRVLIEEERRREQEEALKQLSVGDVKDGTITNITDYGLFVDLDGITGLVHISNLAWTPLRQHPSKLYEVGQEISVQVLDIDAESRKVSLGVKQLTANPWDTLMENYPVGSVIEGRVKKVTDFGIFIGIVEGINGLVHVSDISWTQTVKPADHYRRGQTVQAKILDIDRANERVNLGIKQLEPNPWEELPRRYAAGTIVNGRVVNITDFGLFVEIEEGIQGLVHISELPPATVDNPLEEYQVGQDVEARVIEVLPDEKKIRLTMKTEKPKKAAAHEKQQPKGEAGDTAFGQLLREKMGDQGETDE